MAVYLNRPLKTMENRLLGSDDRRMRQCHRIGIAPLHHSAPDAMQASKQVTALKDTPSSFCVVSLNITAGTLGRGAGSATTEIPPPPSSRAQQQAAMPRRESRLPSLPYSSESAQNRSFNASCPIRGPVMWP